MMQLCFRAKVFRFMDHRLTGQFTTTLHWLIYLRVLPDELIRHIVTVKPTAAECATNKFQERPSRLDPRPVPDGLS